MKNLKLSTILVAAILFLSSCNQFIQLIETESVGKDAVTKEGVCQNEDLRISYDMWSEDGITYFSIYNKTDKPMYIDWKRSVFIFNDWKYDYWVEKSKQCYIRKKNFYCSSRALHIRSSAHKRISSDDLHHHEWFYNFNKHYC
jgi:hypothetical protein